LFSPWCFGNKVMYLISTFVFLVMFAPALAHVGGLNKDGCHNNRKIYEYHCHREKKSLPEQQFLPQQQTLTGIPMIIDGDTIRIGNTRIRLHGIDAPEARQTCNAGGKEWRCGWEATNALAKIIGHHWVACTKHGTDRYGRVLAVCRIGLININAWMVDNGWAAAYRRYSEEYVLNERNAKAAGKGVWRGHFVLPWVWRKRVKN
jgi:endonuclease YncB( thermonuclease family)